MERTQIIEKLEEYARQSELAARSIEAGVAALQPEYAALFENLASLSLATPEALRKRNQYINDLYPRVVLDAREALRRRDEVATFRAALELLR
jgi:hypothetical protein